jgi:hypothetical protein
MHSPSSDDRDEPPPTQRPEQNQRDTEPTTPRSGLPVPSEQPIASHTEPRPRESTMRSSDDTLTSSLVPADELDAPLEDPRIGELERRIEQLEARISVLELSSGHAARNGRRWLAWIGFMIALAVAWQLVDRLR